MAMEGGTSRSWRRQWACHGREEGATRVWGSFALIIGETQDSLTASFV
jgi:hypothetical protein